MATSDHLGLYLPTREDYISVKRDLSDNYEVIDEAIEALDNGIAIVVNGDNAPTNITSGQYLFIKNNSTLATGGYHATANISNGAAVTSSNVAADSAGIANALNGNLNTKAKASIHDILPASGSVTINLESGTPKCMIAISRASDATYAGLYMVGINWARTVCPIVANTKYTLSIDSNGVLTVANSGTSAAQVSVYF